MYQECDQDHTFNVFPIDEDHARHLFHYSCFCQPEVIIEEDDEGELYTLIYHKTVN